MSNEDDSLSHSRQVLVIVLSDKIYADYASQHLWELSMN